MRLKEWVWRLNRKGLAPKIAISIIMSLVLAVSSPMLMTVNAAAPCWDWETVPHYNQKEKPWASLPYWYKTVEKRGCGPCSMAAAVSGITGKKVTPKKLLKSKANGLRDPMLSYVGKHYGIKYKTIPKTVKAYKKALKSKKMIWVTIRGECSSGPWKTKVGGHYILLYGYKNGKCKIMDSNGDPGQKVAGKYCIKVKDAANWTQSSVGPVALWGKRKVTHHWKFVEYTKKTAAGHTRLETCSKCGKTRERFIVHDAGNTGQIEKDGEICNRCKVCKKTWTARED